MRDGSFRVGAALQELQGHIHAELVIANGAVDGPHAAPADQAHDRVGTDAPTDQPAIVRLGAPVAGGLRHGGFQNVCRVAVGRQERLHLPAQVLIAAAGRVQERPPLRRREVGGSVEDVFDSAPAFLAHVGGGAVRNLRSQASPRRRSRFTVGSVKPIASAISSRFIPPK